MYTEVLAKYYIRRVFEHLFDKTRYNDYSEEFQNGYEQCLNDIEKILDIKYDADDIDEHFNFKNQEDCLTVKEFYKIIKERNALDCDMVLCSKKMYKLTDGFADPDKKIVGLFINYDNEIDPYAKKLESQGKEYRDNVY